MIVMDDDDDDDAFDFDAIDQLVAQHQSKKVRLNETSLMTVFLYNQSLPCLNLPPLQSCTHARKISRL